MSERSMHESLMDYLGQWKTMRVALPGGERVRLPDTPEEFVFDHGTAFHATVELPRRQLSVRDRLCYWNAWRLKSKNPQLRYAEGFLYAEHMLLPVLHGWCVDTDGRVADPSVTQHTERVYHGVVFHDAFARQVWSGLARRSLIGILPNVWQLDLSADALVAGVDAAFAPATEQHC